MCLMDKANHNHVSDNSLYLISSVLELDGARSLELQSTSWRHKQLRGDGGIVFALLMAASGSPNDMTVKSIEHL